MDRAYGAGSGPDIAAADGAIIAKERLLGVVRTWTGERQAARPGSAQPPAARRTRTPLALLVLAAVAAAVAVGYVLARQADDSMEAAHRQALAGALDVLRAASPDLARADAQVDAQVIPMLERASGLKDLRFETDPSPDGRAVQSLLDRNGRIVGWLSWEPERPATAMMARLLPMAALAAAALAGLAALLLQHLGRLGRRLAHSEQHVRQLAFEDPLTGLPNHNHFFAQLDRALARRHGNEPLAFATVDLDGFDEVNGTLGYAGGDEVLAEIGKRLRDAITPSTMIARLGSDEFAVLVTGKNAEVADFVIEDVRHALVQPIWLNQVVQVGASVGLAVAPRDGLTRDDLTRRADLALRTAKRRGRGTVVAFASEMEGEFQEQRFIKREAARTLAARGFDVHYQPIVAADSGAVAGVEALLRWEHPARGLISPAQFVPVVEEAGLMGQLGEFVLRRAISDGLCWDGLYVSVNLSPVQMRDPAFVGMVASVLQEHGFPPARLVLEMTEGVLIDNPDETAARLAELRALGVRLALDDFGSGYSSLRYLQKLPFDKLKVDRSFVDALEKSANGGVIIQAIVALGRALGMGVVIEGIETEQQRVLLRLAGCNEMQGYLFAKPAPREEITQLLEAVRGTSSGVHPATRPLAQSATPQPRTPEPALTHAAPG